jgi:alkanesulfonate monooxygenase SsuD/methylene tetrahydromethanopterin reductase-like flavin-dependent oxidoreductase (luciferase family)
VKFVLLPHLPRQDRSDGDQLSELVDTAILAEQLGFDDYGIGERHDRPSGSSAPAVLLSPTATRASTLGWRPETAPAQA